MQREYFSIANITIVLIYPEAPYNLSLSPAMEEFRIKKAETPDISFTVDTDSAYPSLNTYKRIFTTHPSGPWSIYSRPEGGYVIVFQNLQKEKNPHKVVIVDENFCKFHIYNKITPDNQLVPLEHPFDELALSGYLNLNRIGIILHSASVCINGRGYLFSGTSGSGKSTISELFLRDKDSLVLTDERVIIREHRGKLWAFGTPWHGTAKVHKNSGAPIEGIFFIKHGGENKATYLSKTDAINRLMVRCFPTFWNRSGMEFVLDFCIRIASEIACYELEFLPEFSVVRYIKDYFV
jgi:hypothetical protein